MFPQYLCGVRNVKPLFVMPMKLFKIKDLFKLHLESKLLTASLFKHFLNVKIKKKGKEKIGWNLESRTWNLGFHDQSESKVKSRIKPFLWWTQSCDFP